MVRRYYKLVAILISLGILTYTACGGGGGGVQPPINGAAYVGSAKCSGCHEDQFDKFKHSAHPYQLNKVSGSAPTYPYSAVPAPPPGSTWGDVAYVIGGFGWKAQFVGQNGNIITGAQSQYNLTNQTWVAYHAGETLPYDCGSCHTTGFSSIGSQDGKAGIKGTWAEAGVTCEACHGPASLHTDNPKRSNINIDSTNGKTDPAESCVKCHVRNNTSVIEASGGFITSHEQADELAKSPHNGRVGCVDCHDPHGSVIYEDQVNNPDGGLSKSCEDCHSAEIAFQKSTAMKALGVTCVDCHMPNLGKNAVGDPASFKGDLRTHIITINLDPTAQQFSPDGSQSNPYITLQYACLQCHSAAGPGQEMTLQDLANYAKEFHLPEGGDVYVGSDKCQVCHPEVVDTFKDTGHASILKKVINNQPPEYPDSTVPNPPAGVSWSDVSYVIGGFAWKAEFIGDDGNIITGNSQYNLANGQFVSYHNGETLPYDCATCHTTGYDAVGHQGNLPGIQGTWNEAGVTCEACHGPGGAHINDHTAATINLPGAPDEACKKCHTDGDINVIDAEGGFAKNHVQAEEFAQSPHSAFLKCSSCHDIHKSVKYKDNILNPKQGIKIQCALCHPDQATKQKSETMKGELECQDCHMPPMGKSAIGNLSKLTGDLRSHLFKININPSATQFSPDGTAENPYITLQYACQRCHSAAGGAVEINLDGLSAFASDYHSTGGGGGETGYIGSQTCSICHSDIYKKHIRSGHPHQLTQVAGASPDYPYSDVPNPPAGYSWNDISYVIGGFAWKADFIGNDGNIITGNAAQYNLDSSAFTSFHSGETLPYNCGNCHTTGYDPTGHQGDLAGISGTWSEEGVTCEACHGPGKQHVAAPSFSTINLDGDPNDRCADCHANGDINTINAEGGFIKSEQQAKEFKQSPHGAFDCTLCHNPHESAKYEDAQYNPDKGIANDCATCHPEKVDEQKSANMKGQLDCIDCHMPPMVKSAIGDITKLKADVRTHLFRINTDAAALQFKAGETQSNGYITVQYACQRCHMTGGGAPPMEIEGLAGYAKNYHTQIDPTSYVGSATCGVCHSTLYQEHIRSGHPNILNKINGYNPPDFPYSAVPNPPAGYIWNEIAYVVGGFGWKANFVDKNGYLITGESGDETQYNRADQTWSPYYPGELRPYDCGRCHSTGYSSTGHQDNMPGIYGTWEEEGVTCEACHGYGGTHIGNPSPSTINLEGDPADKCFSCHSRGDLETIEADNGFTENHEQAEEFLQSPHEANLECTTCHDPHKSTKYTDGTYNPDGGLNIDCETCHAQEAAYQKSQTMVSAGLKCIDCHMAPMSKSAIGDVTKYTGDSPSHLWRINTDANAPQFSPDGTVTQPYITVGYACKRCHIAGGGATPIPLGGLAGFARGYHTAPSPGTFAGSDQCAACHTDQYIKFRRSGHSWELSKVENGLAPTFPYSSVPDPPAGYSWDNISYVVGGYGWKARFIDDQGYLITGSGSDKTQYNLETGQFVPYLTGQVKPYDCGRCHTTGYSASGHQDGLPGIVGTWNEAGVWCEACHGPGAQHTHNPGPSTINLSGDPNGKCQDCHVGDDIDIIKASGGFTENEQQASELKQSPHGGTLECSSCHDPHLSAVYYDAVNNPNKGISTNCATCHTEQAANGIQGSMYVYSNNCLLCHMPYMVKSAVGDLTEYRGDVRAHLFQFDISPTYEQFTPDGLQTNSNVSLTYGCMHCHREGGAGSPYSLEQLAWGANGIHGG